MKLSELNAHFVGNGGTGVRSADGTPVPRREGVLLAFDCPKCGREGERHGGILCYLDPAMDGGPAVSSHNWQRTGDSIDNLTLSPSILVLSGCGWHGFIRNGEIVDA